MILNTKANYKHFLLEESKEFGSSRYENSVNHMKETYVTLEQQWCCATLLTVENMLISFAGELFKFNTNSANKESIVSFGTLLLCCLSKQANKISKGPLQSLLPKLTV